VYRLAGASEKAERRRSPRDFRQRPCGCWTGRRGLRIYYGNTDISARCRLGFASRRWRSAISIGGVLRRMVRVSSVARSQTFRERGDDCRTGKWSVSALSRRRVGAGPQAPLLLVSQRNDAIHYSRIARIHALYYPRISR
jgi:hypothetical protein